MPELSYTQQAAYDALKAAKGKGVVMPVSTGTKLVTLGLAVKSETSGHGKARAEYFLA